MLHLIYNIAKLDFNCSFNHVLAHQTDSFKTEAGGTSPGLEVG